MARIHIQVLTPGKGWQELTASMPRTADEARAIVNAYPGPCRAYTQGAAHLPGVHLCENQAERDRQAAYAEEDRAWFAARVRFGVLCPTAEQLAEVRQDLTKGEG